MGTSDHTRLTKDKDKDKTRDRDICQGCNRIGHLRVVCPLRDVCPDFNPTGNFAGSTTDVTLTRGRMEDPFHSIPTLRHDHPLHLAVVITIAITIEITHTAIAIENRTVAVGTRRSWQYLTNMGNKETGNVHSMYITVYSMYSMYIVCTV